MRPLLAALLVTTLAAPLAWSAFQEPDHPPTPGLASTVRWEYRVVSLSDLHASTLDYLKGALAEREGGVLGLANAVDDKLAQKTEDLLNELGAEGWELLHYSSTSMILMRPAR